MLKFTSVVLEIKITSKPGENKNGLRNFVSLNLIAFLGTFLKKPLIMRWNWVVTAVNIANFFLSTVRDFWLWIMTKIK